MDFRGGGAGVEPWCLSRLGIHCITSLNEAVENGNILLCRALPGRDLAFSKGNSLSSGCWAKLIICFWGTPISSPMMVWGMIVTPESMS